jgi:hypothetical protein
MRRELLFQILRRKVRPQLVNRYGLDIGLDTLEVAHELSKMIAKIKFVELKKIHYNVMSRVMDMNEADIGRAKSVLARHYALYELDGLTDTYIQCWERLGVSYNN